MYTTSACNRMEGHKEIFEGDTMRSYRDYAGFSHTTGGIRVAFKGLMHTQCVAVTPLQDSCTLKFFVLYFHSSSLYAIKPIKPLRSSVVSKVIHHKFDNTETRIHELKYSF